MRAPAGSFAQEKPEVTARKIAALKLRVRTALLASCFTWLQAGRPNDHEVCLGDYSRIALGVKARLL